jgi:D-serine/D-alanine/glycine transporter
VWAMIIVSYLVYRRRDAARHAASSYKMPGGVVMCWAVLAFFVFVIWTLCTERETALALAWFPLWFVVLAAGWLIVRRRPGHSERYRRFRAEMNHAVAEDAETAPVAS